MKPFFAMEGVDGYVEPAAEPIEGEEPDINMDTARVEENVLALDNAYMGIENALESLEVLEKIKGAVEGSGEELSEAALKIVSITVENVKAQLGVFTPEEMTALESVKDTKFSMEGFKSVIQAIWDAIVRTFSWIWETLSSLIGLNAKVRKEKLNESVLNTMDLKTVSEEKTLTTGKIFEALNFLGTEITLDVLRQNSKDLVESMDSTIKLYKAASDAEDEIFKVLNRMLEKAKAGEDTSEFVGELRDIGLGFIKEQASCYKKDSSQVHNYRLALPESSYMRESIRLGYGLNRGRAVVLSAAILKDGSEELSPHLEIAQLRQPVGTKSITIESMKGTEYHSFLSSYGKDANSSGGELFSLVAKTGPKLKHNLYKLEAELKRVEGSMGSETIKAFRVFSQLARQLGEVQIKASTVHGEIIKSGFIYYDIAKAVGFMMKK